MYTFSPVVPYSMIDSMCNEPGIAAIRHKPKHETIRDTPHLPNHFWFPMQVTEVPYNLVLIIWVVFQACTYVKPVEESSAIIAWFRIEARIVWTTERSLETIFVT
jgi:hypothetical protein